MKRVPGSVLWLLRFPGLGEPNIRAEAKAHGIDPTRIYFSDVLPRAEHLARVYLVDIILHHLWLITFGYVIVQPSFSCSCTSGRKIFGLGFVKQHLLCKICSFYEIRLMLMTRTESYSGTRIRMLWQLVASFAIE